MNQRERELCRSSYAAQLDCLGYNPDGSPKMIRQGRERSNEEIIHGLRELREMARLGFTLTSKDLSFLDDAARRIEDLEERIDILMAELPDDGKRFSGLMEE